MSTWSLAPGRYEPTLGDTLILAALLIPATFVRAWLALCLWEWFATPAGLPDLPFTVAAGAGFLITLYKGHARPKAEPVDYGAVLTGAFLYPFMVAAAAFLVRVALWMAGYP
jgi:hypothetical protein